VFEFAFFAYDGSWSHANLLREADAYEVPPRLVATGKHPGVLDPCGSFLRVDPEAIRVTTIKPAESGDAMVVRLFNPTNAPIQATLAPSPSAESAHELALSETPIRPLPIEGGCIGPIEIRPMGIITLGIRSEDRGE